MKDAPLDMRMDATQSLTAADIVNTWPIEELVEILQKYGEEERAVQIARIIVDARRDKKIETTAELVRPIVSTIHRQGKIHPATKTFQALRIAVNDEMESLKEVLRNAIQILKKDGRIVVISFHSLEDRIVKNEFRSFENNAQGAVITKKPIIATSEETKQNVRARSAKMRVFEKK
jgi:16S rRNA (cytosine1402-N4)-methyltransferase